jgi:hypothetical protein
MFLGVSHFQKLLVLACDRYRLRAISTAVHWINKVEPKPSKSLNQLESTAEHHHPPRGGTAPRIAQMRGISLRKIVVGRAHFQGSCYLQYAQSAHRTMPFSTCNGPCHNVPQTPSHGCLVKVHRRTASSRPAAQGSTAEPLFEERIARGAHGGLPLAKLAVFSPIFKRNIRRHKDSHCIVSISLVALNH